MDKEICEMFFNNIKNEIAEFEHHMKAQGCDYVYNHSYLISKWRELEWFFLSYVEENTEGFYDDIIAPLSKVDNICESIIDDYSQYSHPEDFDFFWCEDLYAIIIHFIKKQTKGVILW